MACTVESHEALKQNAMVFHAATEFYAYAEDEDEQGRPIRVEYRHCKLCRSTLVHPAPTNYTIAYNVETKKPGCPIMQSALGATIPSALLELYFDEKYWEVGNPHGMQVLPIPEWKLPQLADITSLAHE